MTRTLGMGALLALPLLLAGCSPQATGTPQPAPAASAGPQSPRPARSAQPGAVGLIAEVGKQRMQVQGNNQQTAVTWTDQTRITRQAAVAAADVRVGDCVTVRLAGTPGAGPATAASIAVAGADACTGRTPNPARSAAPGGAPAAGGGTARPGRGGQAGVFGTVSKVDRGSFTISGTGTGETVVQTTPTTTFSRTEAGTGADLKAGQCAVASGRSDASGTIAATSISVSAPVNGQCQGRTRG